MFTHNCTTCWFTAGGYLIDMSESLRDQTHDLACSSLCFFSKPKSYKTPDVKPSTPKNLFLEKKTRPGTEEHNNGSQVLIFFSCLGLLLKEKKRGEEKAQKNGKLNGDTGRRTTRSSARTELSDSRATWVVNQRRENRNGCENGTLLSSPDRRPACVGEFQRIFESSFIIFFFFAPCFAPSSLKRVLQVCPRRKGQFSCA